MHYQKCFDHRFLGSWDFDEVQEMDVTIKETKEEEIRENDGGKKQKWVVYFKEGKKGLVLSPTKGKQIADATNESDILKWPGKKIRLYKTTCQAFGDTVDCVRVKKVEVKK